MQNPGQYWRVNDLIGRNSESSGVSLSAGSADSQTAVQLDEVYSDVKGRVRFRLAHESGAAEEFEVEPSLEIPVVFPKAGT